jgi:hypothetical protein
VSPATVSPERLAALAAVVDTFHITDRAMQRAQRAFATACAGRAPTQAEASAYLRAVRTYFEGFAHDADAQLANVDRELERLYQRQYNLAAERGVAVKRIEAVQGVLALLAELPLG